MQASPEKNSVTTSPTPEKSKELLLPSKKHNDLTYIRLEKIIKLVKIPGIEKKITDTHLEIIASIIKIFNIHNSTHPSIRTTQILMAQYTIETLLTDLFEQRTSPFINFCMTVEPYYLSKINLKNIYSDADLYIPEYLPQQDILCYLYRENKKDIVYILIKQEILVPSYQLALDAYKKNDFELLEFLFKNKEFRKSYSSKLLLEICKDNYIFDIKERLFDLCIKFEETDVNIEDENGRSCLNWIVRNGKFKHVKAIIDRGAKDKQHNSNYSEIFSSAINRDTTEVAELLFETFNYKIDESQTTDFGESYLYPALCSIEQLNYLLDKMHSTPNKAVLAKAMFELCDKTPPNADLMAKKLLSIDPNILDYFADFNIEYDALTLVAQHQFMRKNKYYANNITNLVKVLLEHDKNNRNNAEKALIAATEAYNETIAILILERYNTSNTQNISLLNAVKENLKFLVFELLCHPKLDTTIIKPAIKNFKSKSNISYRLLQGGNIINQIANKSHYSFNCENIDIYIAKILNANSLTIKNNIFAWPEDKKRLFCQFCDFFASFIRKDSSNYAYKYCLMFNNFIAAIKLIVTKEIYKPLVLQDDSIYDDDSFNSFSESYSESSDDEELSSLSESSSASGNFDLLPEDEDFSNPELTTYQPIAIMNNSSYNFDILYHEIAEYELKSVTTYIFHSVTDTGKINILEAARSEKWDKVNALIKIPNININITNSNYGNLTLLAYAIIFKQPKIVKKLLSREDIIINNITPQSLSQYNLTIEDYNQKVSTHQKEYLSQNNSLLCHAPLQFENTPNSSKNSMGHSNLSKCNF